MKRWPFKDPDEILDYEIEWSARLAGDTIVTSAWTVPVGITKTQQSQSPVATIVWLTGGTIGETYAILNRIVTVGGRTMDQSVLLQVRSK
jgi:hypothetical protein